MALTLTTPRIFNTNETKNYTSGRSKCSCCPYGYHIDVDFVRYCEAIAAGSIESRVHDERRRKKERRRQCQSMEFLLGLTNPADVKKEKKTTENESLGTIPSSPRVPQPPQLNKFFAPNLDLSDVVRDFEATLKRSSSFKQPNYGSNIVFDASDLCYQPLHFSQPEVLDRTENVTPNGGNSSHSTGTLQNIREQMAVSLKKMKELEQQVKLIPMLQVQVSVLQEEKRNLLRQIESISKTNETLSRFRSHSFSGKFSSPYPDRGAIEEAKKSTRDATTNCNVPTREVGISHRQIYTREAESMTSPRTLSPRQSLYFPLLSSIIDSPNPEISLDRIICSPDSAPSLLSETQNRDFGVNTPRRSLEQSLLLAVENITPEPTQQCTQETMTQIKMADILAQEKSKNPISSKETQCTVEDRIIRRNWGTQTTEPFKIRCNVGISVTPRVRSTASLTLKTESKSVAVGSDNSPIRSISLSCMDLVTSSADHYDGLKPQTKPRTVRSVSVGVNQSDLVKFVTKATETLDLEPRKKDSGTSPPRKMFVDVSVGDSVQSHIDISCAVNYCDNCKETIKSLAMKIEEAAPAQISPTSRIPRLLHGAGGSSDQRKPFKRQDTYTKIGHTDEVRYDSDNKELYAKDFRSQYQESSKINTLADTENKPRENDPDCIHTESILFQPIQEKIREKATLSKEMRAAMKVLNDNLEKPPSRNISNQIKNATTIIQHEWFKISSTVNSNPATLEDYLDCFEEYSSKLLAYVVNMTDSSGNTAMHYAVSHGNFDVVSILLDSKVTDINKVNTAGYTPVMLAALAEVRSSTHASVASRIFKLADVNVRATLHGQTALMLAVSHGRIDMTKLLLEAGAAINIQDEDGSTALMCAAEHGHTGIVKLLLSHPECDPSILDVDGSSALKIALEAGHRDIGVLLYAHEHVNRGTSPYSSFRRGRLGSKPSTPTGSCPSAPASPAPSRRFHSSTSSLNTGKYCTK